MDIIRALLMSATGARHVRPDLFSWCVLAYIYVIRTDTLGYLDAQGLCMPLYFDGGVLLC